MRRYSYRAAGAESEWLNGETLRRAVLELYVCGSVHANGDARRIDKPTPNVTNDQPYCYLHSINSNSNGVGGPAVYSNQAQCSNPNCLYPGAPTNFEPLSSMPHASRRRVFTKCQTRTEW